MPLFLLDILLPNVKARASPHMCLRIKGFSMLNPNWYKIVIVKIFIKLQIVNLQMDVCLFTLIKACELT